MVSNVFNCFYVYLFLGGNDPILTNIFSDGLKPPTVALFHFVSNLPSQSSSLEEGMS